MSSDAHFGGDDVGSTTELPAECYDILSHPRRIRLLEVLAGRPRSATVSDLTEAIYERERAAETDDPTRHEVRISLVHSHLPRLADANVIAWQGETVSLVGDLPLRPEAFSSLLERSAAAGDEDVLETLVQPTRMAVLAILSDFDRACSLEELATAIAAADRSPIDDPERATIALHHSHLPAMEDVGVLAYDEIAKEVTRTNRSVPVTQ
ncbi:ArsR family transcriptional regulator [Natrialbaceae archaeon GCM10025810]|uniref:DUF7344 domain-containing protein n=1 Tax=Halovalidus salilacus TaxID=3075124 RepID=UPI00360F90BC